MAKKEEDFFFTAVLNGFERKEVGYPLLPHYHHPKMKEKDARKQNAVESLKEPTRYRLLREPAAGATHATAGSSARARTQWRQARTTQALAQPFANTLSRSRNQNTRLVAGRGRVTSVLISLTSFLG